MPSLPTLPVRGTPAGRSQRWVAVAVAGVLLTAPACGDAGAGGSPRALRVLAASSLTEVFRRLEPEFEAAHRSVDVVLQFGSSATVAAQLEAGAPADVFVTADVAIADRLVGAGVVGAPTEIATNELALLVASGNPRNIEGLADLDRPGVVFVLCAAAAPCGHLGVAALRRAAVRSAPAAREENVKAVVGRVLLGEADAGIVYASDVRAAGARAEGIAISNADSELRARYAAAVVRRSGRTATASAWIDFVRAPAGRRALRDAGFAPTDGTRS